MNIFPIIVLVFVASVGALGYGIVQGVGVTTPDVVTIKIMLSGLLGLCVGIGLLAAESGD